MFLACYTRSLFGFRYSCLMRKDQGKLLKATLSNAWALYGVHTRLETGSPVPWPVLKKTSTRFSQHRPALKVWLGLRTSLRQTHTPSRSHSQAKCTPYQESAILQGEKPECQSQQQLQICTRDRVHRLEKQMTTDGDDNCEGRRKMDDAPPQPPWRRCPVAGLSPTPS